MLSVGLEKVFCRCRATESSASAARLATLQWATHVCVNRNCNINTSCYYQLNNDSSRRRLAKSDSVLTFSYSSRLLDACQRVPVGQLSIASMDLITWFVLHIWMGREENTQRTYLFQQDEIESTFFGRTVAKSHPSNDEHIDYYSCWIQHLHQPPLHFKIKSNHNDPNTRHCRTGIATDIKGRVLAKMIQWLLYLTFKSYQKKRD